MSTISNCAANYTTPCAPCYIAASTAIHSFPYELTTIEVEATPYIFAGKDGSPSTSWKYVTLTQTSHANVSDDGSKPTGTSNAIIFDNATGVTWTTRDLTLTYPTTYVEYHDFSGVGVDASNTTACAQTDSVSQFILASKTVEMSFVMQWKPTGTASYAYPGPATSIPPEILTYLDTIPAVTSQLGGQPIESCLPANVAPECTTPLISQSGICSTECITGLPTSTMYYTNISTSILPASVQTFTAYSWNSPSYSYSSHAETTVYDTSISSTILVNTNGNYTKTSCWASCVAGEETTSTLAFLTFKLTTASVLTTINKEPIFATVPDGIVNVDSTPTVTTPAKPVATPPPDTITAKATTSASPQSRASPIALPIEGPQDLDDDSERGSTLCTDALCILTATTGASPERTQRASAGNNDEPEPTISNEDHENASPTELNNGAVITAGSRTFPVSVASGGVLVVGSATISSGKAFTLDNGQVISMDTSAIHIGSSAFPFSAVSNSEPTPSGILFTDTEGGVRTATQISSGIFAVEDATLSSGQDLTLSNGEVLHVNSGGVQLGSSTLKLTALNAEITAAVFYTAGGQTLTPGGTITQGTATISLDNSGQTYYVNGAPTPVSDGVLGLDGTKYTAHTSATSTDIADYIMGAISSAIARSTKTTSISDSGVGGNGGSAATPSPTAGGVQGLRASKFCGAGLALVAIFAAVM